MGANIPLPALSVNTSYPNPLDEYMRAVQLKGTLQQEQLQAGQIQQQKMELQDQQNIRSLAPQYAIKDENGKVTGFDTEGYFNDLMAHQVNPTKIAAMRNQQAEMTKNLAQAGTAQLDLHEKTNDQVYQILEGVRDAAKKGPDQAQQAYLQALPKVRQLGIDVSQYPTQYPGDDFLAEKEVGLGVHKQMLEDAKSVAATKESGAKTEEAAAGTAEKQAATEKTKIETEALKQFGGLTPQMIEAKYISEMQKPEGHRDQKFLSAVKNYKEIVPQFNIAMQTPVMPQAAGGGTDWGAAAKRYGMTPEALDAVAERWQHAGQLPPIGRGGQGQAKNQLIMNYAADKYKGESLTADSAEYKANQEALRKIQGTADQVGAFEKTAGRNLDLFLSKLENIPDLKVKFLNTPIRMINDKMIGTQAYQEMKAAQQTASAEAAKVLSSANASGVLSDTQKKEAEDILSGNLSLNAARGVVATLHQDMNNRTQSYQDQIGTIQKRLRGNTTPPSTSPPAQAGGFNWKSHPEYKPQ